MEVTRKCLVCRKVKVIEVSAKGYSNWKHGMPIQQALPEVNADDRELLMTEICGACYDKLFE